MRLEWILLALTLIGCGSTDHAMKPVDAGAAINVGSIKGNIAPGANCEYSTDGAIISEGSFDLAPSMRPPGRCTNSYNAVLLVASHWKPPPPNDSIEPNVLSVSSAEVALTTSEKRPIAFEFNGEKLANPFSVSVTALQLRPASGKTPELGLAPVEIIPRAYGPSLGEFVGERILISVTLYGQSTSGDDALFPPFLYPVALCNGCSTFCRSQPEADSAMRQIAGDATCADGSGVDGRVCVDPDC